MKTCHYSQSRLIANSLGFSLVELMIGITIVSLLMMLALPSYQVWIQNLQIRNAAESILDGLQLARTEAVQRNTQVQFQLTDGTGLSNWSVVADDPTIPGIDFTAPNGVVVQSRDNTEGSQNARVGASTVAAGLQVYANPLAGGAGMPATITFNGLGRVVNVGADITRADVVNTLVAGTRRLVVTISPGGQIRLCDPAFTLPNNSMGCPP